MRILLLTQEDIRSPRNGAQHYSRSIHDRLIELGHTGQVISLREPGEFSRQDGWDFLFPVPMALQPSVIQNLSTLPRMTKACYSRAAKEAVTEAANAAELVILDHLAACGHVPNINNRPFIYIQHNDEFSSKLSFLDELPSGLLRIAHWIDLQKISLLQNRIYQQAAAISAISEAEFFKLRQHSSTKTKSFLIEPVRGATANRGATKSPIRPGLLVVVGTFKWTPKRAALHRLVDTFVRLQPSEGPLTLRLAGSFYQQDIEEIASKSSHIEFIPDFRDLDSVLSDAQIGLLIDGAGGGFKMKFLDYIQYDCIIYSLRHDVPSHRLLDGVNCRIFHSTENLLEAATKECMDEDFVSAIRTRAHQDFATYFDESRQRDSVRRLLDAATTIYPVVQ